MPAKFTLPAELASSFMLPLQLVLELSDVILARRRRSIWSHSLETSVRLGLAGKRALGWG
jgi:hypothetical protein